MFLVAQWLRRPGRVDRVFTIKQVGWMTAFISQIILEATFTTSTSLLVFEPAGRGL